MNTKINAKWRTAIIIAVSCFCLVTCPNPLNEEMLLHVKDELGPVVVVTSPAEGSLCANIVEVTGQATDAATSGATDGRIRSLAYSVLGSAVSGTTDVAPGGAFSFQFSTVTLGSSFTLSIEALDWNDNRTEVLRSLLRQSGNGIPSFAVSAGNQSVTANWDSVPHTVSYTLHYATNGSLPSEQVGTKLENVTPPVVLADLVNGNVHVFQLKTVPETGWPESLSDYIKAIPLSPLTLAPRVIGELQQIRVEWPPIAGAKEFEVWRSIAQEASFYNISGPIEGTSFLDADAEKGSWYWYKVKPVLAGSSISYANAVQASPFCIHSPRLVGTCPTTSAEDAAVSGSFAYVADHQAGLRVIDISNPLVPVPKGICDTDDAWAVAVSGSYAYVADGSSGLRVINITDPLAPSLTATRDQVLARDVVVSGDYAYVADADYMSPGLKVIDIKDPSAPIVGTYNTDSWLDGEPFGVAVSYPNAFLICGNGLVVVDVTNAQAPSYKARLNDVWGNSIAVSGSHAYVTNNGGLVVIDVSNPASPLVKGTYASVDAEGVTVKGSYAYVSGGIRGLLVVDVSNPGSPILRGSCATTAAQAAAVSGPYAFVADYVSGLRVIDVSGIAAPAIVGNCTAASLAMGVAVSGSYAYVADHASGLKVINIANPSLPILEGTCPAMGGELFGQVKISGPFAFVATNGGLVVIDISDPRHPTRKATCGGGQAIAVQGSYAYLTDRYVGLRILDISVPEFPTLKGTCVATYPLGVAVRGSYAYLADHNSGLRVIDISDPLSPRITGTCSTSTAWAVAVSGSYAYVADGPSGLRVIDISDPYQPQLKGTCATSATYGVAISGSYALVADYSGGLKVIDISVPSSPTLVCTCNTSWSYGVDVVGRYAFVADAILGLRVIDLLP